jgi:hypothetical protein
VIAVAVFVVLSLVIVGIHLAGWLASSNEPEAFWTRVGWPLATFALGSLWTVALAIASWRVVQSTPAPVAAVVNLTATIATPIVLAVLVNVPYKGVSASEFTDVFLIPGGLTPGGNGTLQHLLMVIAAAGVVAVQIAHATAPRGVASNS